MKPSTICCSNYTVNLLNWLDLQGSGVMDTQYLLTYCPTYNHHLFYAVGWLTLLPPPVTRFVLSPTFEALGAIVRAFTLLTHCRKAHNSSSISESPTVTTVSLSAFYWVNWGLLSQISSMSSCYNVLDNWNHKDENNNVRLALSSETGMTQLCLALTDSCYYIKF